MSVAEDKVKKRKRKAEMVAAAAMGDSKKVVMFLGEKG